MKEIRRKEKYLTCAMSAALAAGGVNAEANNNWETEVKAAVRSAYILPYVNKPIAGESFQTIFKFNRSDGMGIEIFTNKNIGKKGREKFDELDMTLSKTYKMNNFELEKHISYLAVDGDGDYVQPGVKLRVKNNDSSFVLKSEMSGNISLNGNNRTDFYTSIGFEAQTPNRIFSFIRPKVGVEIFKNFAPKWAGININSGIEIEINKNTKLEMGYNHIRSLTDVEDVGVRKPFRASAWGIQLEVKF